jgi:Ca2+-binding RTX toxin-like protein
MAKKHVISEDSTTSFEIKQDDSLWILKKGVTVDAAGLNVFDNVSHAEENVEFVIAGQIGGPASTMWSGIGAYGRHNHIEITDTGSIEGGYWGILAFGKDAEIVNQGTVSGSVAGMELGQKGFVLKNSGLITTDALDGDAIHINSSSARGMIINEQGGTINGVVDAVNGGPITFVNRGTIADVANVNIEVYLGYGDDRFVNRGTLDGAAFLGAGNDVADLRNGSTTGVVSGGVGNDTYIVNQNDGQAYEYAGEGIDTLKTSVSFAATQAGEMEKFVAIGTSNITIVANDLDNTIIGNRGRNLLDGGAGDDVFRGGKGADIFNFGTGDDSDRVMDFENGKDRIDVSGWDNIDDFTDIKAIATVSGDDLVFAFGNEDITIRNMKMSELDAGDFIF